MEARKIIAIAMMAGFGIAVWRMDAMQEQGAGHVGMQQEGAELRLISDENEEAVSLPVEDVRLFGSIEPILRSQQIVPWKEAAPLEMHVPMSAAVLEKIVQEIPWIREVHNQMREGETEKQAAARIVMTMPRVPFNLNRLQEAIACAEAADYLMQPALEQRYAREIAGMVTSDEALTVLAKNNPELIALISDSSINQDVKRVIFSYMPQTGTEFTVRDLGQLSASVAISADGKTVVTGSYDRAAKIVQWDGSQWKKQYILHGSRIRSVAISADGKTVVTGFFDGTAKIVQWNGSEWAEQYTIPHGRGSRVVSVAISADGNTAVTGSSVGTAKIVKRNGSQWVKQYTIRHEKVVNSVAISADGNTVVTGSADNTAKIVQRNGYQWEEPYTIRHTNETGSVAISADGKTVVTGSDDRTAKIVRWNGSQWVERYTISHTQTFKSVAISADGDTVVTGSEDGTAKIVRWNGSQWVERYTISHTQTIKSVAISADGDTVVTGSEDGAAKIVKRNGSQWEQKYTIRHGDSIKSVAISADGDTVVTGSEDGTAKIVRLLPADTFDQVLLRQLLEWAKRKTLQL
jgi:WD40 repeat protein